MIRMLVGIEVDYGRVDIESLVHESQLQSMAFALDQPSERFALVLEQQGGRSEFARIKLEFAVLRRIEFVI